MLTIKERNGLTINTPDAGEKTLFLDTDSKLKTKDENGVIEEVSIVSANTPKVYKALLTQSDTDAPVATVLENTLGGEVVWSREGVGIYFGTLIGGFPENKCSIGNGTDGAGNLILRAQADGYETYFGRFNDDTIRIDNYAFTTFSTTFSYIDGIYANNVCISIEVYP